MKKWNRRGEASIGIILIMGAMMLGMFLLHKFKGSRSSDHSDGKSGAAQEPAEHKSSEGGHH